MFLLNKKWLTATSLLLACGFMLSAAIAAPVTPENSQQTLNLDSQSLGLEGPFQVGTQYSDAYGLLVNTKFAHSLGVDNAVALELDLGAKEYRLGATFARALTPTQRIKITIERLVQKIDFDFASGNVNKWVGQNAIGVGYQYLLNKGVLQSIDTDFYYAKAQSKNLSDKTFSQGVNLRHIAGAISKGMAAGIHLFPWKTGLINLALNYDSVKYNTKYESTDNNSEGLGITGSIEQLLAKNIKLNIAASMRKPYDQYGAGISWLVHTAPGTRLEFQVLGTHITGHVSLNSENRVGITVAYSWGGDRNDNSVAAYSLNNALATSLLNWVKQPIVHMAEVLAIKDEKVIAAATINPVSINANGVIKVRPNQLIDLSVVNIFNTASNQAVTYEVDDLPTQYLRYNAEEKEITGSFPKDQLGKSFVVLLSANTNLLHAVKKIKQQLTFQVIDCTPPASQAIAPQTVYTDGSKAMTIDTKKLGDFQPGDLKFDLLRNGGLSSMVIDENSGAITLPGDTPAKQYSAVIVEAKNDCGITNQSFTIAVVKADLPTIDPAITDQWMSVGANSLDLDSNFHYNGTVDSHNYLKYSFENTPSQFSLQDFKHAVISADIPEGAARSPYAVTIVADKYINDNDSGLTADQAFKVFVRPSVSSSKHEYAAITKNTVKTYDAKKDGDFHSNGSPALIYSLQGDFDALKINAATGVISNTKNTDYGDHNFTVVGTKDPGSATLSPSSVSVDWPVELKVIPKTPKINDQWVNSNINLSLLSAFNDANDKLTYSVTSGQSWLSINDGVLTGVLPNPEEAKESVTVKGAISSGESATGSFAMYVIPEAQGAYENTYNLNAQIDPIDLASGFKYEGDKSWWTYTVNNLPAGLELTAGKISGSVVRAGKYEFSVIGTKNPASATLSPATKSADWSITLNIMPIVKEIPNKWINATKSQDIYNLNDYFDGGQGATFSYSVDPGNDFSINNNELVGPQSAPSDTTSFYTINKITGTTHGLAANSNAFVLYLKPVAKGLEQTIKYNMPVTIKASDAFKYVDGNTTYKITGGALPDGLSFNEQTGEITGSAHPAITQTTEYSVDIEATKTASGLNAQSTTATIKLTMPAPAALSCPSPDKLGNLPYTAYDTKDVAHTFNGHKTISPVESKYYGSLDGSIFTCTYQDPGEITIPHSVSTTLPTASGYMHGKTVYFEEE